ncbi:MAG: hypothetical protein K8R31_12730 [Bacteroidales bacterium]|nr:hypothetical protein [Bacteroidales bacterium]
MEHVYYFIGAIIIIFGTILLSMAKKKVIKIFSGSIIFVGMLFSWIGTTQSSKLSEKRITDSYNKKAKELEFFIDSVISNDTISFDEKIKIKNEANKINRWASKEISDFDSVIIQLEKRKIQEKEEQYEFNKEWIPLCKDIFKSIEEVIIEYNKQNEDTIKITHTGKFPNDLFALNDQKYYMTISFYDQLEFDVYITQYGSSVNIKIRLYVFDEDTNKFILSFGECSFAIFKSYKYINIRKFGHFENFPLKEEYSYRKTPAEAVRQVFSEIIYYQIHLLQ